MTRVAHGQSWRIETETGTLGEVLMCRPEHFNWLPSCETAAATIAAGLDFDHEAAMEQHRGLAACIEAAGARIHWLDPLPSLPDLCWTRDSSHMTPWGAMITSLSAPVRSGENEVAEAFYQAAGHSIWRRVDAGNVEGGDIHFIAPGQAVIGYSGVRTTLAGAKQLQGWAEAEGWEVRLQPVDPVYVHLDVVFCMAAEGLAVVCREATGDDFPRWLKERGIHCLDVSVPDTLALGCNLLALGNERVVVPAHCDSVHEQLRAEGLEVFAVDLDMFTLDGGGVHCLTQPLRREG